MLDIFFYHMYSICLVNFKVFISYLCIACNTGPVECIHVLSFNSVDRRLQSYTNIVLEYVIVCALVLLSLWQCILHTLSAVSYFTTSFVIVLFIVLGQPTRLIKLSVYLIM